jgi:hypothetical protein
VSVEVSNNGADLTSSGVQFVYERAPLFRTINPSVIPAFVAQIVTLSGHGFKPRMDVRVWDHQFACHRLVSDTSFHSCEFKIIPIPPGNYSIEFSVCGRALDSGSGLSVLAVITPVISSVSPSKVSIWTGVLITVSGYNLKYLDGGFCKIRNEQTDINIINNNRASCYSPSVSQPSIEDLYVCSKSLHCILAAAVTFQQMPFVALSAARFDWCSQNILVDVVGKHLEDALCVFSQNLWKDTFTPRLISSTHILCKARVHQF